MYGGFFICNKSMQIFVSIKNRNAMSETKKTAADYRMELMMLNAKIKALEARIAERLHALCERFPDANIGVQLGSSGSTVIKASSIGSMIYISRIGTQERLEYIEAIEKWIAEQNPVKQTKIKFE